MSRASSHAATTLDSIKHSLVGLRMPRALEVLDATVRRIEQGEIDGITALDEILTASALPPRRSCPAASSPRRSAPSRGQCSACGARAR